MFRSVRRPSSGVGSRALYNYYLSIFLLLRINCVHELVMKSKCNNMHGESKKDCNFKVLW